MCIHFVGPNNIWLDFHGRESWDSEELRKAPAKKKLKQTVQAWFKKERSQRETHNKGRHAGKQKTQELQANRGRRSKCREQSPGYTGEQGIKSARIQALQLGAMKRCRFRQMCRWQLTQFVLHFHGYF